MIEQAGFGNFSALTSGFWLMLILGLRHGIDPDHIAIIDGMTLRVLKLKPKLAPWVGTLFALGHGLTVTAIAVIVSLISFKFSLSPLAKNFIEHLPTALLLIIGSLNLASLLRRKQYQAIGWKQYILPKFLASSTHPISIVAVGVIFAAVFDTATQAAAWGYIATSKGGVWLALATGVVFSLGMMLTDTLDGRLMCKLIKQADQANMQAYRRAVGFFIVALSFGIAFYSIATQIYPKVELTEQNFTWLGIIFVAIAVTGYIGLYLKQANNELNISTKEVAIEPQSMTANNISRNGLEN